MELWDLYTENRVKTGEIHVRGNPIPEDRYHLVVSVWIKNSEGKYLISQRSESRQINPLKYECVDGSVLKDESSIDGAICETKEEVGIDLLPKMGKLIFSNVRKKFGGKIFKYDGKIDLNNATAYEVKKVSWMTVEEINELFNKNIMVFTLSVVFNKVTEYFCMN